MKIRNYLPKILVGIYIIAAIVFIWFIYMQNRSSHLETALLKDESQSAERIQPTLSSSGGQEAQSNENQGSLAVSPEPQSDKNQMPLAVSQETPRAERIQPTLSSSAGQEAISDERTKDVSSEQYDR
jgi:hypothetical protein